jgi:hypothetical protein
MMGCGIVLFFAFSETGDEIVQGLLLMQSQNKMMFVRGLETNREGEV